MVAAAAAQLRGGGAPSGGRPALRRRTRAVLLAPAAGVSPGPLLLRAGPLARGGGRGQGDPGGRQVEQARVCAGADRGRHAARPAGSRRCRRLSGTGGSTGPRPSRARRRVPGCARAGRAGSTTRGGGPSARYGPRRTRPGKRRVGTGRAVVLGSPGWG